MGRHADPRPQHLSERLSRPRSRRILVAAAAVLLVATGGVVWLVAGSGLSSAGGCDSPSRVRVTVAPALAPVATKLLADSLPTDGGGCVRASVTSQRPLETVGDMGSLQPSALPQIWVPDSSLWAARAGGTGLSDSGSMALSPVVVATGRNVAQQLGWQQNAPSWAQIVSSNRPIAMPDLAGSTEGLAALAAVRASLGGNQQADDAVVAAVLAAERGPAISTSDALAAGGSNAATAALVPVSEQEVYAAHRRSAGSALVAVYPSDGSPRLDYPVLRVARAGDSTSAAVNAVVARLRSADARSAVLAAGFRTASGAGPSDAGSSTGIQKVAPGALPLDPAQAQQLLAQLAKLATPSRILSVFDVSTSMEGQVGGGTRATLERDAAKSALALVPGTSAIGLWDFAYHLNGVDDWKELVPTRRLDEQADGRAQRELLDSALDGLPDHLAPGGTGLYDTTLAAVRAARSSYDPSSVNSVLLVTDGADDDDSTGIQLDQLVATLKSEADPAKPVKIIAVGLGPDADMDALREVSSVTNGAAYSAVDPRDLQTVLFDALRQRG